MLGRRALGGVLSRAVALAGGGGGRCIRPPGGLSWQVPTGQQLGRRWLKVLTSESAPETVKSYTIRLEDIPEAKAATLSKADIIQLFGAFEPFNIVITKGEPKEKGGKPPVTATFQVPSLNYAKNIVTSFDKSDESWGERMSVKQEAPMYPVFFSNLPDRMTPADLKKQIDKAGVEFAKLAQTKTLGGLIASTPVDVYESYAVFRCSNQFESLGLLQGNFEYVVTGGGGGGDGGAEEGAAGAEQEGADDEAAGGSNDIYTYAAWKTFPVRVNNIPPEVSAEDLWRAFKRFMPYDVEILSGPTEAGNKTSRSAYLRFARQTSATLCVEEMSGFTLGKHDLDVRSAWQPLYPVLVKGVSSASEAVSALARDLKPVESEVVVDLQGTKAVIFRFASPAKAREAVEALNGGDKAADLAWREFTLTLTNLPAGYTEKHVKDDVNHTSPYEVVVETIPATGLTRAKVSYFTKAEADKAFMQMSGSGIEGLKMRKEWLVYRLKVTDLPKDVTEAEIMEGLRGHEPYSVDLLLSRRGKPKGEALLKFRTYDGMLAAIQKLHGRDSLMDEAMNEARWEMKSVEEKRARSLGAGKNSIDDVMAMIDRSVRDDDEVRAQLERTMAGMSKEELEEIVKGRHAKKEEEEEESSSMIARAETAARELELREGGEEDEDEEGVNDFGDDDVDEDLDGNAETLRVVDALGEEEEEEGAAFERAFGLNPEGGWVKMVLDSGTTQTTLRGGRLMSYRTLVVVGNLNGSGGWGVGKGDTPEEAQNRAFRDAKKNLIHLDLFRGRALTTALYGKHNNCRVYIQAGNPRVPSKEGRLVNDILRIMGIDCGEARSVGRRNPYSLVRAIFHALSKHQGVEEIARKRGRRLISMSHARYLGI